MLVFFLHRRNEDASLPWVCSVATVLLELSCKSSVIYTALHALWLTLADKKGEIDGPSVTASLVSWFCMQGMRPSWLCLQFRAVIHCVWGKSRISLGHVILLVHASRIFVAVEMFFVGIYLLRLVPGALQKRLAAFITAALTVAPNAQLRWYNRYGKKCGSKSEILGVRSWCSIHYLACERVFQNLIKIFSWAKMHWVRSFHPL